MKKKLKLSIFSDKDHIYIGFNKKIKALPLTLDEAERIGLDLYMRSKALKKEKEGSAIILVH